MKGLDKAQRKLFAGFFEKFAVALATAVAAKIFFAEEGMTVMTWCAIAAMFLSLILSMVLVHGTDEKASPQQAQQTPPPAADRTVRGRRKRK